MPHDAMSMESKQATVTVAGRQVTLTEADGEKLRLALIDYLSRAADPEQQKEAFRLEKAVPHIDEGQLRVGVWVLEGGERSLVMSRTVRDTTKAMVLQLAYVEGQPGGTWRVTSTGEEILHMDED